jgi:hypothetical protein
MLIKFYLLSFLFMATSAVYCQTRIAANAGVNFSNIHFKYEGVPVFSGVLIPRLNAGLIVEIPLEKNWHLYISPAYSGKGTNYGKALLTGKRDSFRIRLNYLELPVNIGYKFSSGNNKIIISGGVFGGWGFGGKMWTTPSPVPPTKNLHRKKTDEYKRVEFGYDISTLYEVNNAWGIKMNYSGSMFNIHRSSKQRNNVFGFSLFLFLNKN